MRWQCQSSGAQAFGLDNRQNCRHNHGLFRRAAAGKILGMTPDTDLARTAFNRIRPKNYAFKSAIIGPNPR